MQERRTTVRVPYQCRTQYCAAEDLLPRDGRLINVSERGAGLQVREARKAGDQVTTSFTLPGSADTLTATGVVRWSSPSGKGRWHTLGMEWLPLEETSRNRLHAFLQAQPAAPTAAPVKTASTIASPGSKINFAWGVWALVFLTVGVIVVGWVRSLQQRAKNLEYGLVQSGTVINVLKDREQRMAQREKWLRQELVTAKTHLASASGELSQLDGQVQLLGSDALRLRQEVDLFQQSYNQAQQERSELIQQVLNLEQERLKLVGKLSSLPELQRAIRETIDAKRAAQRAERMAFFGLNPQQPRFISDKDISPNDNQGFVIRNGIPTMHRGPGMSIRVLEPTAGDSIKK